MKSPTGLKDKRPPIFPM